MSKTSTTYSIYWSQAETSTLFFILSKCSVSTMGITEKKSLLCSVLLYWTRGFVCVSCSDSVNQVRTSTRIAPEMCISSLSLSLFFGMASLSSMEIQFAVEILIGMSWWIGGMILNLCCDLSSVYCQIVTCHSSEASHGSCSHSATDAESCIPRRSRCSTRTSTTCAARARVSPLRLEFHF